MRLNINQLVYDEESETYVEKSHKTKIHQEPQSNKYRDEYFSWRKRCGNKRQDDIKRQRRLERRYVKDLRNLRILEGWREQEELNKWLEL